MSGLQTPVLGTVLQFDVASSPFVQVLHDGDVHWVVVASPPADIAADVIVYDSLHDNINKHCKMQIASLVVAAHSPLRCAIDTTQRQRGTIDCGLFAIAVATSLCFGERPQLYEQATMRDHFRHCMAAGEMTPFPSGRVVMEKCRIVEIQLYCSCRLPDNGAERMVQCNRCRTWYHQSCELVDTEVFTRKSQVWYCTICKR